jgi:hypothetical protein
MPSRRGRASRRPATCADVRHVEVENAEASRSSVEASRRRGVEASRRRGVEATRCRGLDIEHRDRVSAPRSNIDASSIEASSVERRGVEASSVERRGVEHRGVEASSVDVECRSLEVEHPDRASTRGRTSMRGVALECRGSEARADSSNVDASRPFGDDARQCMLGAAYPGCSNMRALGISKHGTRPCRRHPSRNSQVRGSRTVSGT